MWGYAFLGVSTALASAYYEGRNNSIKNLMIWNGVFSVGSAILTLVDVHWVMTMGGLVAFFGWNALMIVMMILIYIDTTRKYRSESLRTSNIN